VAEPGGVTGQHGQRGQRDQRGRRDRVPAGNRPAGRAISTGPGRVLIAVYLLFSIAATARAGYQIATKFDEAPLAYLLSALAALIYIAASYGLSRSGRTGRGIALTSCSLELAGVLSVGALSVFDPALFPDDTVWSRFGQGYGYLPLVLPVLGLLWLRRTRPNRAA
jgi:cytochrome bd-type quinol oxidase subunit 2